MDGCSDDEEGCGIPLGEELEGAWVRGVLACMLAHARPHQPACSACHRVPAGKGGGILPLSSHTRCTAQVVAMVAGFTELTPDVQTRLLSLLGSDPVLRAAKPPPANLTRLYKQVGLCPAYLHLAPSLIAGRLHGLANP
jgi:hypothetical protein